MNLRLQAAADLQAILSDTANGFARALTVTPPVGAPVALTGLWTDVGMSIDPNTGMMVTGRKASVSIARAALRAAGLADPKGVADSASKPWVISYVELDGVTTTRWKVSDVAPDRGLDIVTCMLEKYVGP